MFSTIRLFLVFNFLFLFPATPGLAQEQKILRDWVAICSTDNKCSAQTTATGRTDSITYRFTLILRRAVADDSWHVAIKMEGAEPASTSALIFQVDDGANFRFEPDEVFRSEDQTFELFDGPKIEHLVKAFREGEKLWLTFHDERIRETGLGFSLSGVIASLVWIEEQQLAGAGIEAVPERIVRLHELDPDCETEVPAEIFQPEQHVLDENLVLHIVPCGWGAYNFVARLYIEDKRYDEIRALAFAWYSDANGWSGATALINATFDPETMELTSFAKGRGLGDCGSFSKYVWNEFTFKLLEYAHWEECDGSRMPEEWPVIYRAEK